MRCRREPADVVDHVIVEGGPPPAHLQYACGTIDPSLAPTMSGSDEFFPEGGGSNKFHFCFEYACMGQGVLS